LLKKENNRKMATNTTRRWQQTQHAKDKTRLNRAFRRLKEALQEQKETSFKEYLENLSANKEAIMFCGNALKIYNHRSY
jgi:methylmalonyl-CoA mutase N-terminal domain/subunit